MQPLIVEYCVSELTNFQLYFCSLFPTSGNKTKHSRHPCASAQEILEDVSEMPGFREEKRLTRSVSYWKLRKGKPEMSSFTKAVISFKIIIVRSTEFVNALEQAIFPTLSHKAPQFLCNLTVSSSREDMSQSGSSVPFNKERNPCPHCGVALSVSEFCKLQ